MLEPNCPNAYADQQTSKQAIVTILGSTFPPTALPILFVFDSLNAVAISAEQLEGCASPIRIFHDYRMAATEAETARFLTVSLAPSVDMIHLQSPTIIESAANTFAAKEIHQFLEYAITVTLIINLISCTAFFCAKQFRTRLF